MSLSTNTLSSASTTALTPVLAAKTPAYAANMLGPLFFLCDDDGVDGAGTRGGTSAWMLFCWLPHRKQLVFGRDGRQRLQTAMDLSSTARPSIPVL
ncbi:hypothetical protein MIND_00901300 [Mycena indigotica]|uniref:Uncharacterized protein n=1 Tax=Mycena indigotica TaxID=2126181 RepID=A0A8H6SHE6_9AGAR|nr:uncharacterized protein MIND_00901300 [Mycena indigotica]KAF7299511.1 hypothetical protein MIND_00901300 [Mycena indigotica]